MFLTFPLDAVLKLPLQALSFIDIRNECYCTAGSASNRYLAQVPGVSIYHWQQRPGQQ